MGLTHPNHIDLHPGADTEHAGVSHRLHIPDTELQFSRHCASLLASLEGRKFVCGFGGILGDPTGRMTSTNDNSATQAWVGGGLRMLSNAAPSDNDSQSRTGLETQTVAAGQTWVASTRAQVSNAANTGIVAGFCTSGTTNIYAAAPADGWYFIKSKNGTGLTGRVIANGAAAVDLALFNTDYDGTAASAYTFADATDVQLGVEVYFGATVDVCYGYWKVNGIRTPFSAAQITALFDILNTTPATMSWHVGTRLNGTTQRSVTIAWFLAEADR